MKMLHVPLHARDVIATIGANDRDLFRSTGRNIDSQSGVSYLFRSNVHFVNIMCVTGCTCQWMPSRVPDVLSRSIRSRCGQGAQTLHRTPKSDLNTVWTTFGKVHSRTTSFERHIGNSLSTSNDSSSSTRSHVASQLVLEVIQKIEGTDRGAEAPEYLQKEVENLLRKLEDLGQAQVKMIADPKIHQLKRCR